MKIDLTDDCMKLTEYVVKAMKIIDNTNNDSDSTEDYFWITAEEYTICRPCSILAFSPLVPKALTKNRRRNFGIVKQYQAKNKYDEAVRNHVMRDLHKWCVVQEK